MTREILRHLFDIVFCVALLRTALGALFRYRHLTRLLFNLALLAAMVALIRWVRLPLASYLSLALAVPAAAIIVLNALPELMRLYKGRQKGQALLGARAHAHEVMRALGLAIREMAKTGHGALIVFPQQDDVSTLLNGGEEVDMRVNAAIVRSLFNPACPRHDGAMVVRGDRITQIGAVLPLAAGDDVDPTWGTRHLAALGLSQRCDADVVVISEERFAITHFKKGESTAILVADDDIAKLLRIVFHRVPKGKTERRAARLSWWLWAASLLLAVVGTFYIDVVRASFAPSEAAVSVHEATLELINLPETLLVDDLPSRARIQVTVPEEQSIVRINPTLRIVLDMEGAQPGRVVRTLRKDMVRDLPDGWSVDRITPSEARFNLLRR
jgi:diadenylate cyclase